MAPLRPFCAGRALRQVFLESFSGHKTQPCPMQKRNVTIARHLIKHSSRQKKAANFVPLARRAKINEEITTEYVQLVDPATNKLRPPMDRVFVLKSFDRKIERLVCLNEDPRGVNGRGLATCKIVNIKEEALKEQKAEKAANEARRANAMANSIKTLEINWNIDPHDLGHRMNKAKDFLRAGRQVEIVLARKRKANRATIEQCQQLVNTIVKELESIDGAKLAKPMEGQLEHIAQLHFKVSPAVNTASSQADMPKPPPSAEQSVQPP